MSISSLIFLAVFFGLSVLCLVRSPTYGIFLYEFVYFMNPHARWWYGQIPHLRYSFYIILLIIVGYLVRRDRFAANRIFDIPQFRWLAGLTVVVLLSRFWAVDNVYYEWLATMYLKFSFFALLLYKMLDSRKDLDRAMLIYMAGLFYIGFIAWQVGRGATGRVEGIGVPDGQEVNGTAAAMVTAVPMMLYWVLFASKRWMQFLALVGLAFVLNGLVLLNSRGAFLATIFSVAWFAVAVLREKGLKSVKWKLVAGMVGGICLFFYLTDDLFWARMQTMETVSTQAEGGTRMLFWLKTFDMLADHPLGTGMLGYQILSPQYLPSEWLTGGARAVHSLWFEVLASFGYQGVLVFAGYIGSTFYLAGKVKQYLRAKNEQYHVLQLVSLEASFVAFLVAATFINRFYAEMLYWLPALIGVFANVYMIKPMRKEAVAHEADVKT